MFWSIREGLLLRTASSPPPTFRIADGGLALLGDLVRSVSLSREIVRRQRPIQGPVFQPTSALIVAGILPDLETEIVKPIRSKVKGFVVQPRRWVSVERTIAWLNRCRRGWPPDWREPQPQRARLHQDLAG